MTPEQTPRRSFLAASGASALAAGLNAAQAADDVATRPLKVALIGCGGRGSGAANQAMSADPGARLSYMADLFPDRLESSYANLKKQKGDQVDVTEDGKFVGFDAYQKVMASDADVVILTTPPHFRPAMLEAAVKAGKHIFCEKPMAVDGPGVRRVMAAVAESKKKSINLVCGFCWRYDLPKRETYGKILNEGAIGDVHTVYNTYQTGPTWAKERQPDWSDLEWQMRNWVQTPWLSGDHIVEQAVHSIDMMSWAFGDAKVAKVTGNGGRQVYSDPNKWANCYDHFAVVYEYEDGRRGFHFSRKIPGCSNSYECEMIGSKGSALAMKALIKPTGGEDWRYKGPKKNMYQVEHDELFASIRKGQIINNGEWMINSTMLAIMGREACYNRQDDQLRPDAQQRVQLRPAALGLREAAAARPGADARPEAGIAKGIPASLSRVRSAGSPMGPTVGRPHPSPGSESQDY